jgi:hypothetical protein
MPAKKSAQKKKVAKKTIKKAVPVAKTNPFPPLPSVRMNVELKNEWCEALRSGKFKQGKSLLCNKTDKKNPTYCCLGVLAEILVKKDLLKVVDPPENAINGAVYYCPTHENFDPRQAGGRIPESVATLIGLDDPNVVDNQTVLIHMNDSFKRTFQQISDHIYLHV